MPEFIQVASQFGFGGLCALACGWYVVQHDQACNKAHEEMQKQNIEERKSFVATLASQHAEALAQAKENSAALERNTAILTELRTIISRS